LSANKKYKYILRKKRLGRKFI